MGSGYGQPCSANPRDLLKAIHGALKPGETLVVHEYFNYSSWSLSPRQPGLAEFVQLVISSWRKSGGEPDIGLELMSWLPQEGFRLREVRPIVDVVGPRDFIWQWPSTFVDVGKHYTPVPFGPAWQYRGLVFM